jgi:hypothetical protein
MAKKPVTTTKTPAAEPSRLRVLPNASNTAPKGTSGLAASVRGKPVSFDTGEGELEHRQFPRAKVQVPVHVWIGEGKDRTFSATLASANFSVSGAFLESTFFLKMGTELSLSFQIDEDGDEVVAHAEVVREERPARTDESGGRSGMGLRFKSFDEQSEVTLARLFLGETLSEFAQVYLASSRAKALGNEFERVVDALAAWELLRVTRNNDPWNLGLVANLPPTRGKGR